MVGTAHGENQDTVCCILKQGDNMKNMDKLYRTIQQQHWGMPLLGLLVAHHWIQGNLTSGWWWLFIIITVASGVWKR